MIRVAKNDLSIRFANLLAGEAFDRATRAHGHESRQLNHTARSGEPTSTRTAILIDMQQFKFETWTVQVNSTFEVVFQ